MIQGPILVFLLFAIVSLPFSILDYGKKTFSVKLLYKFIFFCCLFYFIIVAGARYCPRSDWINYMGAFEASGRIGSIYFPRYFEIGFEFLINVIKTFSNHYIVFFITYEIIVCFFLYYNIKKYFGYSISVCCLYFPIIFLTLDMIQMRTLMAVQIFIFSIQYIKEKKIIQYFLYILCASTIHITAIILFPMYFILNRRYKSSTIIIITIFGILINLFQIDFVIPMIRLISPMMGEYINNKITAYVFSGNLFSRSLGLIHLEFIVFFVLFMKYRKNIESGNIYANIFLNLYILYGADIFYLWKVLMFSGRLKFYFILSLIFLLPRLLKINRKSFLFAFVCYISYVLLMVIYVVYYQSTFGKESPLFYFEYANYFFL